VIENYLTMASNARRRTNQNVKTILQPRLTASAGPNSHIFQHYGRSVGEDHKPQIGAFREPPTADVLRINHYFSRSEEEWHHKLARPGAAFQATRGAYALPPEDERNETILRFVPALKDALAHRTTGPHHPLPTSSGPPLA
jgi:hypothetical protein